MDAAVLDAMKRWADDDLRSLNGQIEYVLRRALKDAGRNVRKGPAATPAAPDDLGQSED